MERSYESAAALARRAVGPLAKHLGAYVTSMIDQQYVAAVVYVKARHALAFDQWLTKRRVQLIDLSEVHIDRFQRRTRRVHRSIRTETRRREWFDVTQLLRFLRDRGICQAGRIESTAAGGIAADFGRHLQIQRGLSIATIERYQRAAWQFLHERFGCCSDVDLQELRASDVIEFVQREAQRLQPPALKCVVNAMRSFLRYAQYRGEAAPGLVAAVPAVATWTTTPSLPKAISPVHAQRAIDSCDLSTDLVPQKWTPRGRLH